MVSRRKTRKYFLVNRLKGDFPEIFFPGKYTPYTVLLIVTIAA